MMNHGIRLPSEERGSTADEHDGHLFSVGSGDGIQNTEAPHPIGHHRRAQSNHASITVGRIAGVEFIAVADPADGTVIPCINENPKQFPGTRNRCSTPASSSF